MQTDDFVNLTNSDWPDHNLSVLKFCKEETDKAVAALMAEYPSTPHRPVVRGVFAWDRLDNFLEAAANQNLFKGITAHWIEFKGAPILELRGKYTSLTAKHVLTREEDIKDSKNGYRTNNKVKNQENMELFSEFETPESEDDLLHIVLQHGGRKDSFAFLKAYFVDSDPVSLTSDLMAMESLEIHPATELVAPPSVTLKDPAAIEQPETLPAVPAAKNDNDDSQS
jgi:hypothetical protein